MICGHCGKLFNGGHAKHQLTEKNDKTSFAFCSEDCKKMYV